MRCHHIQDEIGGKVMIPGCWGGVIHGWSGCTCYSKKSAGKEQTPIQRENAELRKENAELKRIIKKLTGQTK